MLTKWRWPGDDGRPFNEKSFQLLVISASSQRHTCAQLQSELWVSWRHQFPPFLAPKENLYFTSSKCLNVILWLFNQSKTWTRMLLACSPRLPWRHDRPLERLQSRLVDSATWWAFFYSTSGWSTCFLPNTKNNLRQRSLLTRKKSPRRDTQRGPKKKKNGRRRTCWHRYRSAILGPGPIRRICLVRLFWQRHQRALPVFLVINGWFEQFIRNQSLFG